MILIPIAVVATAVIGALISVAMGHLHVWPMTLAGGIGLIAALASLLPVILARGELMRSWLKRDCWPR
jgi:CDP-diglyceride synthetase